MTYPGNHTVNRHFDGAGRLDWVQDWVNSTKDTFTYDADGNLTAEALPNGVGTSYGPYDQADQLGDSVAHGSAPANITATKLTTTIMNISYTQRDGLGQLQSETNVLNATTSSSYLYDNVDRLTGVNGVTAYGYDPANTVNQTPSNHTLRYDSADQLCWTLASASASSCAAVPTGATVYGYDHSGNRTSQAPPNGPSVSLAYDDENRLVNYLSGQTSAWYTYNGDGLRTSKTVNSSATAQTWDVAEGIPLLLQDGSTSYVYGPGGAPIEQISSGGSVSYYHTDELGSVRAVSDQTGAQVATYDYDAYGNLTSSTGSISNPLRYTSQYLDSESGLYYLRARYYDPSTGQFISRDPISSTTRAPYAYVADNPLNGTDPTGLYNCGWQPWNCIQLPTSRGQAWNQFTSNATNPQTLAIAAAAGLTAGAGALCIASGVCEATVGALGVGGGNAALNEAEQVGSETAPADTAAAQQACNVTFGHGARHLIGTGPAQGDVEAGIQAAARGAGAGGSWTGRVLVAGQTVEYRAYTLPNGTVNIGTYYVVQ